MICEQCKAEGIKSRVYVGGGISTCMGTSAFYDEEGKFHRHDPNWHSTSYRCSNGHDWTDSRLSECSSCDWAETHAAEVEARRTRLASAIEARRAATENTGAVHESAGPKDDAHE